MNLLFPKNILISYLCYFTFYKHIQDIYCVIMPALMKQPFFSISIK